MIRIAEVFVFREKILPTLNNKSVHIGENKNKLIRKTNAKFAVEAAAFGSRYLH
jgi:hypothetical protein